MIYKCLHFPAKSKSINNSSRIGQHQKPHMEERQSTTLLQIQHQGQWCSDPNSEWLERLQGKQKVLGSIPGLGQHFWPKYDCSLHQEQSLKSSWMISEDLRQNTLAWYTCLNDASMSGSALKITSFGLKTSTSFPQMGHWNSTLCSRLNLDSTNNWKCVGFCHDFKSRVTIFKLQFLRFHWSKCKNFSARQKENCM